jgi:hypothetical protein
MCHTNELGMKIMDCWDCTCSTSVDYRPSGHTPTTKKGRDGNDVTVCSHCGVGL